MASDIDYNYSAINPACLPVDPISRVRPNDRPFVRDFSLFLVVFTSIYVVFSVLKFYYYQKIYVRLQKRSFVMVCVSGLGLICQVYGNALSLAIDYQCWVKVILFVFIVPFLTMALPFRMLDYYNRHIFARKLLLALRENESAEQNAEARQKEPEKDSAASKRVVASGGDADLVISEMESRHGEGVGINSRSLKWLKFLTSTRAKVILITVLMLPYVISIIKDFATYPYLNPAFQCRGCSMSFNSTVLTLTGGALMTIFGVALIVVVRKYPDPFHIVSELVYAAVFGGFICIVGFLLDEVWYDMKYFTFGWLIWLGCVNILFITSDLQVHLAIKNDSPIRGFSDSGSRAGTTQAPGVETGYSQVETVHELPSPSNRTAQTTTVASPPKRGFMRSIRMQPLDPEAELAKERLTYSKLKGLLEVPAVAEGFEEHLVAEFSVELIRMYLECQRFKKEYEELSEINRNARAKRIVETYVYVSAVCQVNLSDLLRNELISVVNSEANVQIDMFKRSDSEILGMMLGAYQRFMKTKKYAEMMEKQKVQTRGPSKSVQGKEKNAITDLTKAASTRFRSNSARDNVVVPVVGGKP